MDEIHLFAERHHFFVLCIDLRLQLACALQLDVKASANIVKLIFDHGEDIRSRH